jgi:hypothetical protein
MEVNHWYISRTFLAEYFPASRLVANFDSFPWAYAQGYMLSPLRGWNLLMQVSPVAWQHINFYGRYEFGKHPDAIDLEYIIQEMVRRRFESRATPVT